MRRIKKRNSTRSTYVDAHKYMVDMYNQEATDKQVSGVTKELPTGAYSNVYPKRQPKEEVIEQGGLIYNTRIVEPEVELVRCKTENFSETFTNKLTEWVNEKHFDYFVTYRPKKTKITEHNAPNLMDRVVLELETLKDLYWVIERDWNGESNHCHMLIGGKVNRSLLAKAMRRTEKEIKYFEPIIDKQDSVRYVSKYLKRDSYIRAYGYLNRNTEIQEAENRWWLDNMPHKETIDTHPNANKQRQAQRVSEYNGWGRLKDRFQDKKIIVNYDRKKGVEVTKIPVNPKREAIIENMRENL